MEILNMGKEDQYYERSYPKYKFQYSKYRILTNDEMNIVMKEKANNIQKRGEIFTLLEMWDLHLITRPEVSFLLEPSFIVDKTGVELHETIKYYEKQEEFYDETKEVKVYISYPFDKNIELLIPPISQTTLFNSVREDKVLPIGFLAWQVSKLFVHKFAMPRYCTRLPICM